MSVVDLILLAVGLLVGASAAYLPDPKGATRPLTAINIFSLALGAQIALLAVSAAGEQFILALLLQALVVPLGWYLGRLEKPQAAPAQSSAGQAATTKLATN